MQTYNFDNINKEYDGNTLLYTCSDNGMPERDIEDPEYDPTQLYFGEYKASIVLSLSVTNTASHTINVDVFVNKGGSVGYVTKKVQIPPATTCVILGGQQKIILEHEDELHIQPFFVQSSPIWDNNDVKIIASVMNLYDYPFIPPMYIEPPVWYGDKGFVTAGDGYANTMDKFFFSTQVVNLSFQSLNPYGRYYLGSCSNVVSGILFSGYGISYPYNQNITNIEFSSDAIIYNYAYPHTSVYNVSTASDAIIYLSAGGYSYTSGRQTMIQKGTYTMGETCVNIGDLERDNQSVGCTNNNEYVVWLGGYYNNNHMQYNEFASESNAQEWAYLGYSGQNFASASIAEIGLTSRGNQYNDTTIQQIEFASKTNSTWFGYLNYANYSQGACGDGISAMFICGENYNRSNIIDFANQGGTSVYANWGFSNRDGGRPACMSGN